MVNIFPSLLTYSFFTPTLLRVAVALVFASVALHQYKTREEIGAVSFPIIGAGMWIPWVTVIIETIIALALFCGYYTQIAAIVGALFALKFFAWGKRYPSVFPLSRAASVLLFCICLSLLVTGAGALAFDVPL